MAGLKGISINLDISKKDLFFMGDIILMQNALRNILDNAIKYSPEDSVIYVKCYKNKKLIISFEDKGRGFVGANHKVRFARGSNVGDVIGSGLGLTIANEVAVVHGGEIGIINNAKGIGSCVSIILPVQLVFIEVHFCFHLKLKKNLFTSQEKVWKL